MESDLFCESVFLSSCAPEETREIYDNECFEEDDWIDEAPPTPPAAHVKAKKLKDKPNIQPTLSLSETIVCLTPRQLMLEPEQQMSSIPHRFFSAEEYYSTWLSAVKIEATAVAKQALENLGRKAAGKVTVTAVLDYRNQSFVIEVALVGTREHERVDTEWTRSGFLVLLQPAGSEAFLAISGTGASTKGAVLEMHSRYSKFAAVATTLQVFPLASLLNFIRQSQVCAYLCVDLSKKCEINYKSIFYIQLFMNYVGRLFYKLSHFLNLQTCLSQPRLPFLTVITLRGIGHNN
jgi:hypothetical protein